MYTHLYYGYSGHMRRREEFYSWWVAKTCVRKNELALTADELLIKQVV